MYYYGPHMGGWGWALGLGSLVFWVLLAAAIIALVVYFIRGGQRRLPPYQGYTGPPGSYGQPRPPSGMGTGTAEQVLAERFARGEIDEAEFRQRLATLRAQTTHPGAATRT